MTMSCSDYLPVELQHAASVPDRNMGEDSAVHVAKRQEETETDEINNLPLKPSETEVICWFGNAEEGLQRERQKFSDMSGPVEERERERMPDSMLN